jgi:beta-N-acetylhexosaminidase
VDGALAVVREPERIAPMSPSRRLRGMSRRDFLRLGAFGAAAIGLGACSPATPSSASPSVVASGPPADEPSEAAGTASPTAPAVPSASSGPSLRQKVAGLVIVGFRGAALDDVGWLRTALVDEGLGGVILFDRDGETGRDRNIISPKQVSRLVRDLRATARTRRILVAIDQEGGVVTRLSPAHGFPPLASEASVGKGSAAEAKAWARGLAETLATAGIDLNLAPVVDLNVNRSNPAIGKLGRSFSADPDVVVEMATIEIEAHRAAGVLTTLKHFPGIGSATKNTDVGAADVTKTWTRAELEPFRRLIASGEADLIMAGHVFNGQLDPQLPASLSPAVVTDLLRGELGWDGVVVTDDLQAAAIDEAFGRDEAIVLALAAGNDLLLFANQQSYDRSIVTDVVDVVVHAIDEGRLDESRVGDAWDRVQRLIT